MNQKEIYMSIYLEINIKLRISIIKLFLILKMIIYCRLFNLSLKIIHTTQIFSLIQIINQIFKICNFYLNNCKKPILKDNYTKSILKIKHTIKKLSTNQQKKIKWNLILLRQSNKRKKQKNNNKMIQLG